MTKGQLESRISEVVCKYEVEINGRGPKKVKTKVMEDFIFTRFGESLTPSAQLLVKNDERARLIRELRKTMFDVSYGYLKSMVEEIINDDIQSMYSDMDPRTGENIIVITTKKNLEAGISNK